MCERERESIKRSVLITNNYSSFTNQIALFEGINDHGKAGCPRQLLGQPDFPVVINVG